VVRLDLIWFRVSVKLVLNYAWRWRYGCDLVYRKEGECGGFRRDLYLSGR
jgi:hypothetical protein